MSSDDSIDSGEVVVVAQGEEQEKENNEPTREQKEKRLGELMSNGRRAIKVGNYEEAADVLSDAVSLSVEIFGEDHEDTFDAHYFYGMATLESAKADSQLLAGGTGQKTAGDAEGAPAGDADEKKKKEEEAAPAERNSDTDDSDHDSEKEEGEESGEEEDDDSMRLAWEVLETARCIAASKIESLEAEKSGVGAIEAWNLKLADVLVLLGEHSVSDGKYDQAREDLDRALTIQRNFLPPTSRQIAQTYMLMGNSSGSQMNFDEAVKFYEKTKETLVARMDELKSQTENEKDQEKKANIDEELKDLEEMVPGVDEMITDAKSSGEQVAETTAAIKEQFAGFTTMLKLLPENEKEAVMVANDISGLVRRPTKRPTEASADDATNINGAKKTKEEQEGTSQL